MMVAEDNLKIFSRLFAAHSALFSFTRAENIVQFMEKLLTNIPGVDAFVIEIKGITFISNLDDFKTLEKLLPNQSHLNFDEYRKLYLEVENISQLNLYPIRTADTLYGFILLKHSSPEIYKPFDPVINSFSIAISTILENLEQKHTLENINFNLENLVTKRTELLNKAQQNLKEALDEAIKALAITVELRDPYTAGHQYRVAHLSRAIAMKLKLSEEKVHQIFLGAMIHDVGKIQVPSEILACPTKLTKLQFDYIKTHPKAGYEIAKSIPLGNIIPDIILHHHERLDGSGYPEGLRGDAIPITTRIVSVADVFEAMVSHRPYRPGHSLEETFNELVLGSGKLYDTNVVNTCIDLITKSQYQLPPEQRTLIDHRIS